MVFGCKKCKKVFRKNIQDFDETDEYCPHCDNHFYLEAKTNEKEGAIVVLEGTSDMIRDDRIKNNSRSILSDLNANVLFG